MLFTGHKPKSLHLCSLLFALCSLLSQIGFAVSKSPVEAQVLSSDNQGLTFTVSVDSVTRLPGGTGAEYSIVTFPAAANFAAQGEPDLPVRPLAIGLPPTGEFRIQASGSGEELISGIDVVPVPRYVRDQPSFKPGPVYDQDAFFPSDLVKVEDIGWVRGVRTARLRVSPVQYNPRRHLCRVYHEVTVQVRFAKPAVANGRGQPLVSEAETGAVPNDILLNGALARGWAVPLDTGVVRNFFSIAPTWYRIKIDSTGVYKLAYSDLKQAGIDPSVLDPRTVRLFTVGEHVPNQAPDSMIEVPLSFQGKRDSVFGTGDYFIFFGQSSSHWNIGYSQFESNLYTPYNYYWLTWGGAPGRRIAAQSSPPGSGAPAHLGNVRQRVEYDSLCPARSGMLWVWHELDKDENQVAESATFDLPMNQPEQLDRLMLSLYSIDPLAAGYVSIPLKVYFNDARLDSLTMGLRGAGNPLNLVYPFDSIGVQPLRDRNAVKLVITGTSLLTMFLDYIELTYHCNLNLKSGTQEFTPDPGASGLVIKNAGAQPFILDITRPENPKLVTDVQLRGDSAAFANTGGDSAAYFAVLPNRLRKPLEILHRTPGNTKLPSLAADYFIIAPDNMYDAVQLLQRYRTGNVRGIPNARVQTVKLSELYDDFSFGLEEPGAIKAFFALKRPQYGLLIGDATYDYRNNLGLNPGPGVPPYEVGADLDPQVYSEAAYALDAWYADFEGQGQSPDMIIGRLTVRTPEEFRSYFDKLVTYEHGDFGFWNKRFVLLADDEILGSDDWTKPQFEDPLRQYHIPACEDMGALAGPGMDLVKVYLTDYPLLNVNDKQGARDALFQQLDNGALLWVFFGHGAGFQLCHERAMGIDDIPRLNNGHKNFFAYFGSCGVGRWEDTKNECIAEELVRKTDGAIATVGATKGTSPLSNEDLCRRMLSVVFAGDSTAGRAFYAGSFVGDKLYHYFGDPALVLQLPLMDTATVTTPDTIRAGAQFSYAAGLPFVTGGYAVAASATAELRQYSSPWLTTSYVLPSGSRPVPSTGGQPPFAAPDAEFLNAIGRVQAGHLSGFARVPNQFVGSHSGPHGSYTPIPKTARVSVLAWDDTHCYSLLRDTLALDTIPAVSTDHKGPEVKLLADGKEIFDGDYLPQNFQLGARITDSSGVLIAPVSQFSPSMYFYVNDATQRTAVADQFNYDIGSSTTGSFACPVTLDLADDTIYVLAADNFLNRTVARRAVHTRFGGVVQIDNPLVYPNPVSGSGYFTFNLNQAARVEIDIHTISGRLVRRIENQDCQLGYNQISWDGTDGQGVRLPNGIYLYRLLAQSSDASSGSNRQTSDRVLEKFIVKH
jgi:hypothetical protein